MSDNWKDSPHWVLRFTKNGEWELAAPDGKVKNTDNGVVQQCLTLDLEVGNMPRFEINGILT